MRPPSPEIGPFGNEPEVRPFWHVVYRYQEPESDESTHEIREIAWADTPHGRFVRWREEDDHGGHTTHWPAALATELGQALLRCATAPEEE